MLSELDTRPAATEQWIRDGLILCVEYDERGVVEVTIEVFRDLIQQLGFTPKEAD